MLFREYTFSLSQQSDIPAEVYIPLLSQEIAELGFNSFQEMKNGSLQAFLPETSFASITEDGVYTLNFPLLDFTYSSTLCPDKNWNEKWEKEHFHPCSIGNKIFVKAPYHKEIETNLKEVLIAPKNAFGSGVHPTTQMMLELLLEEDLVDKQILDIGCGTGILGITALLYGARFSSFIDIDSSSTANTQENLYLNHCREKSFSIHTGTLSSEQKNLPSTAYDFIFANIHRNIIIDDIPLYTSLLKPHGKLLISGFQKGDDISLINKSLSLNNFSNEKEKSKENWVALSQLFRPN